MSPKWTDQQINAITATDGGVLVSAAAGSGKTAVLVERVIRLITREENPVDVDRLLIVTFTRDAAAQMRDKISDALNSLLENDPFNPHLLRQKQLLYNAKISTIDSFCSDIIREYFHTLKIPYDFRVAEKGELNILSLQALDTAFENFYHNGGADFINLVDVFADKQGDENLRKTVLKVAEFLASQPFPEQWLDNMLKNYGSIPIAETIWGKIITEYAHSAVSHAINLTENSLKRVVEDEKLQKKFTERLEEDLDFLTILQKKLPDFSWDEISSYLFSFTSGTFRAPNGYKYNPIKVAISSNRDEVKKTISELQACFAWNELEASEEIAELYRLVSTLFALVKEYLSVFAQLKSRKNIFSFSDIESLTVKLLAEPDDECGCIKTPQAFEISKRFDYVMVDEFQDVNDVQDLIFKCVSNNEENLFVVGDVKQSIYGFRQAKPEIFINRKSRYKKFDSENPLYPATIILDKNFRSRKEVCSAVNFIFKRLMTAQSAKMDYTIDEMLNVGAVYPESDSCNFEIDLIEKNDFPNSDVNETEAYFIADRIHKMISSGICVKDGSKMRPVTYGDFAIIMRSPNENAVKYVNTLINCGIPAYSDSKESFFDALEIKVMLNLLKVIDNPTLDIELLSVVCSPIYGFTPDELSSIRSDNRRTSLYFAIKQFAKNNSKAARFISELDSLREFSYTCSVDELISRVYETTSFGAISLAVSGSEHQIKNLNLLRDYARTYEANGYKTLSDFVSYVDRLIASGTSIEGSASNDAAAINSVRVLSIHSSKGLEYPVCFLADTAHRFNKNDFKSDVLIDSHAGLGVRKKCGHIKQSTFPRLAVEMEMKKNQVAEELRVLYVALTRAKEKLIVISSQDDASEYLNNLYSKIVFDTIIEPYCVSSCQSISDWICLCALVHPSLNALKSRLIPSSALLPADATAGEWEFNIIKNNDFICVSCDDDGNSEIQNIVVSYDNFDYAGLLKKNLAFRYKNEDILLLPQKVTASNIAHEQNNDYFKKILSKPSFINKEVSSSVERGTAHHIFLQYCDFKNALKDIDDEIKRLTAFGHLTAEQADCIDKTSMLKFLSSDLVKRILKSPLVMREERFSAKLEPSLIFDEYKDIKTSALVIIQGAVDLAFEEDGKLIIVDYKTDRVGDISKLKSLYSKQLFLYKKAMEQSTGLKVKECILYSIHLNEYIVV